jgi:hypothetical protein
MNTETFWLMIEVARQQSLNKPEKRQWELLVDALSELTADDIQEFDRIFWSMMARAYRTDVWDAAWLVACGCGDDAFDDFRRWLIAQGQTIYEKVLEDPENLADIVDKQQRFNIFEGWMSSAAKIAYERKMQQPIPDGHREPPVLVGSSLASEAELPAKYPRIIDKIGGCEDEELFQ